VRFFEPRSLPSIPCWRITRATWSRPTPTSRRRFILVRRVRCARSATNAGPVQTPVIPRERAASALPARAARARSRQPRNSAAAIANSPTNAGWTRRRPLVVDASQQGARTTGIRNPVFESAWKELSARERRPMMWCASDRSARSTLFESAKVASATSGSRRPPVAGHSAWPHALSKSTPSIRARAISRRSSLGESWGKYSESSSTVASANTCPATSLNGSQPCPLMRGRMARCPRPGSSLHSNLSLPGS
jgi:hypothetical protein